MHNQFRALTVIFALGLVLSGNLALSNRILAQDGPYKAENADPYANDFSHAQAKKLLEAI